jgi:hypothetical protein
MGFGVSRASGVGLAAVLLFTSAAAGDPPHPAVTIGKQVVSAEAVEAELARVSGARLLAGDNSEDAIRARFVHATLVPRLLLAEHARRSLPTARHRETEALARAMLEAIQRSVPTADAAQVAAYHASHAGEFSQPEALRIWRIPVKDLALARSIIARGAGVQGPEQWRLAAREHSLDEATKYRSGDLGFVRADGSTLVPQVRTDPELFRAASRVQDGQILPEPLAMNGAFAVIWRRGTRKATAVTPTEATPGIQQALRHRQFAQERDRLLADLRARWLREEHPELLELLPSDSGNLDSRSIGPGSADRGPMPSTVAPPRGSAAPPTLTERGLR